LRRRVGAVASCYAFGDRMMSFVRCSVQCSAFSVDVGNARLHLASADDTQPD
jgi:hypothetical protein